MGLLFGTCTLYLKLVNCQISALGRKMTGKGGSDNFLWKDDCKRLFNIHTKYKKWLGLCERYLNKR